MKIVTERHDDGGLTVQCVPSFPRKTTTSQHRCTSIDVTIGPRRSVFDEQQDVNTSDIQGFVRSKLEALSVGLNEHPSGPAKQKLENAAIETMI